MRVGAAAIEGGDVTDGLESLIATAAAPLGGAVPDLAVLFITTPWVEQAAEVAARVVETSGARARRWRPKPER